MKSLLLLSLVGISLQVQTARAQDSFSIETVGDQVCRTKPGQAQRCLPTFKSLGLIAKNEIRMLETFEDGSKVATTTGVPRHQVRKLMESYDLLSIRNLATSPSAIQFKDGQVRVPFFASVYWKGRGYMQGTLHFEGEIRVDQKHLKMSTTAFADSTTEQKLESLRFLETAARHIHFRIAGTGGKSVDEATMDLLNTFIGPVILSETSLTYVNVPTVSPR